MREASLSLIATGGRGDLAQFAVDAKAHAVVVLVGLEVEVGRAHAEGVEQHLVQELDDRRVFDLAGAGVRCVGGILHGDVVELEFAADDAVDASRQRLDAAASTIRDSLSYSAMTQSTPICVANLIFSAASLVRGIGRGNDQAVVALAQHHDPVGLAHLGVEQVLGQALRDRWRRGPAAGAPKAEDTRVGQVCSRNGAGAGQLGNETGAAGLRLAGRSLRPTSAGACQPKSARGPSPGSAIVQSSLTGGIDSGHSTENVKDVKNEPSDHRSIWPQAVNRSAHATGCARIWRSAAAKCWSG